VGHFFVAFAGQSAGGHPMLGNELKKKIAEKVKHFFFTHAINRHKM
jgi:hypothetical protein